ncbi:hypothetical protein JQR88_23390 (plasmid) [Pseudomonas luteola]|uniref:hypothetical protein n=1 Tax=Pseudomonas luteola TaxID=47886 RepID=UPI003D9FC5B9
MTLITCPITLEIISEVPDNNHSIAYHPPNDMEIYSVKLLSHAAFLAATLLLPALAQASDKPLAETLSAFTRCDTSFFRTCFMKIESA